MNHFEEIKAVLAGMEKPVTVFNKRRNDGRKVELRRSLLPKNRRCPRCKTIVLKSRGWVIKWDSVVCKSCYSTEKGEKPKGEIFSNPHERFEVDGKSLAEMRVYLGLSLRKFAELCGWSYSFQHKMERGDLLTVHEDIKKKVEVVIGFIL